MRQQHGLQYGFPEKKEHVYNSHEIIQQAFKQIQTDLHISYIQIKYILQEARKVTV